MCLYFVVRFSQCCSGLYFNYSYQCVFLFLVRCIIINFDVVRMMKVIINRIRFSFISVVMCRLDFVFVNLFVSVEVILLFGIYSEVLLSWQVLLMIKVIVMVLLSVWFSFSMMLLIILFLVNGRMICQIIFQVVQLILQVDFFIIIGVCLNILCIIVVMYGIIMMVRIMFVVRILILNVGLENSVLIIGIFDMILLIGF